ncbi:MAG: Hsp20/alpha crystallin family protein [Bacteroidia bacterium]|jgi:HSP20 family protein|nr:Hsp20/alpha crystallin family protein [Bacteroidia bacterium]
MTLVRFNPQLPSLFDRFFDTELFDWANRHFSATNTTMPSVNILETDDHFEVEVAAPGLKKSDFKVQLDRDVLTISSEKRDEKEEKEGERFTRREFSYQSFSRSFTLPNSADSDKIKATYIDGILKVVIPKREEAKPKPAKQIEIH